MSEVRLKETNISEKRFYQGITQSLVDATNGTVFTTTVAGPLGEEVEAQYGILGDGEIGVLEMASASGIELVP